MDKLLYLLEQGNMSIEDIILNITVSIFIGLVIYFSYWSTHTGTIYSRKFNVSLVMLTVLTASVMTVIGNNLALSLGMVGALSIVRFRTAIKDSRDTVYIFWAIVIGICCGSQDYLVAGLCSTALFIVLLILGRIRNEGRKLIVIKGKRDNLGDVQGYLFQVFDGKARAKVVNTTLNEFEIIYELSSRLLETKEKKGLAIVDDLFKIEGVLIANIVSQTDDIL